MTKYTVFESFLLKKYSAHLFYNQASFVGFVNAYNHLWIKLTPHDDVANRFTLTNQCLSDSWFYYSYIEIAFEYGLDMNHFYYPSMEKLDHTLEATRNKIVGLFLSKWSKVNHGTKCSLESCEEAMVLDGNFKVYRPKCYFHDVFYPFAEAHSQKFRISYPNTPIRGSYYCDDHQNAFDFFKVKTPSGTILS